MYKKIFNRREVLRFKQFSRKGYSLFSCLGREVIVGTLSVATLTNAKADGISIHTELADKDQPQWEVTIDDVEVAGSRVPLALGQAARLITVLSREDIQAAAVQSINDLLKLAAGVDVRQRGPLGAQTDVSIRGGTQEQIAVLLNGINICDPQTAHNTFDLPVDISEIDHIEVIEGPAGRALGTSSLLGAINIVTTMAKATTATATTGTATTTKDVSGAARLEGGSFGYLSLGGHGNITTGAWSNQLSGSYTRSDGYSRSKGGTLNMDYSGGKAFYQGRYDGSDVRLLWHAGMASKGYGSNTFYSAKFDDQYEKTLKWYTAIQGETKGRLHFQPSVYWNRSDDRFELFRDGSEKYPFNYHRSDVFGVNLNSWFSWQLGRTAFGAELRNEDVISGNLGELLDETIHISGTDRDYEYGLNRTNISLHLEHNILLRRFTLSAGFVAVKNTWNMRHFKLYPGIDASYRLSDNWKVYASWNTSLRMPSVTELYYSVGGHKADKHLKPEELSALEAGVKLFGRNVQASVSGFYHHGKNMIDWILDTTMGEEAYWQSVNHTKVNTLGMETRWQLNLQGLMPGQRLLRNVELAYTYLHQDKDLEPQLQSQYALEYLRHKLVARLLLQPVRNVSLSLSYRFQDRMGGYTTTAGEVREYAPYSIVDARLTYDRKAFRVYAEVNNLLNKRDYVDYCNVPQPGLWFTAGVSCHF